MLKIIQDKTRCWAIYLRLIFDLFLSLNYAYIYFTIGFTWSRFVYFTVMLWMLFVTCETTKIREG